jgi:hypothetical protein
MVAAWRLIKFQIGGSFFDHLSRRLFPNRLGRRKRRVHCAGSRDFLPPSPSGEEPRIVVCWMRDFEPQYQKIQKSKLCAAWVAVPKFLRRGIGGTFDDRHLKGIENQANRANNSPSTNRDHGSRPLLSRRQGQFCSQSGSNGRSLEWSDVLPVLLEVAQAFLQCPQHRLGAIPKETLLIPGGDDFALASDMVHAIGNELINLGQILVVGHRAQSSSAFRTSRWVHRRSHFEPVGRAAIAVARILALRHDTFKAEFALVAKDGLAVALHVFVESDASPILAKIISSMALRHTDMCESLRELGRLRSNSV